MKSSAKKIELASVDDLFSTEESRQDEQLEKIQEIPLSELHPFKDHPFKVKDDDAMIETADSIKKYGVLVPAIARPLPDGSYELVPFKWEYGEETISLQLGMYANNQRLYIGMITHTEDGAEPFADMTVNLPGYSLDPGEAFISGDISKDLLRFIKENKLGKVLPYQVQSGYGKYSAVAFDLEKLKAFDPKGVAEFRKEWNLPDKKPVKKKSRGMER